MATKKKITFVGAGNVGSQAAFLAAAKGLGDIVLIDIVENVVKGKALDILQATAPLGKDVSIIGTTDYTMTKDSDIVVITAGVPRKPGMSREDLYTINAKIIEEVIANVVKHSAQCILIIVTNPLDKMVELAFKKSAFAKQRVLGMTGALDTARFKVCIASQLKVPVSSIATFVIGSHGDAMLPLVSQTTVKGMPLSKLLSQEKIADLVEKTKHGGAEIVNLLNTSAYYAPGAAIIEMVESILLDKKKTIACHAYLQGEYGLQGVFTGVPCVLGAKGVEKIIELPLTKEEQQSFHATVRD